MPKSNHSFNGFLPIHKNLATYTHIEYTYMQLHIHANISMCVYVKYVCVYVYNIIYMYK